MARASPHSARVRKCLGVVLTLCACARDGAGDGLFDPTAEQSNGAPLADAALAVESDAGAPPADAAPEAAEVITDAGPRATGDPCASDAQCEDTPCTVVRNGGHSATLCTRPCGLFAPCTAGLACYDDGTNRFCVRGCTDAAPSCPPGLACMPTYPPEKGCIPAP
jgi:hypothetical protein